MAVPCEGKFTGYIWMVEAVPEDRPGGYCAPTPVFPGTKPLGSPKELVLQQQLGIGTTAAEKAVETFWPGFSG